MLLILLENLTIYSSMCEHHSYKSFKGLQNVRHKVHYALTISFIGK